MTLRRKQREVPVDLNEWFSSARKLPEHTVSASIAMLELFDTVHGILGSDYTRVEELPRSVKPADRTLIRHGLKAFHELDVAGPDLETRAFLEPLIRTTLFQASLGKQSLADWTLTANPDCRDLLESRSNSFEISEQNFATLSWVILTTNFLVDLFSSEPWDSVREDLSSYRVGLPVDDHTFDRCAGMLERAAAPGDSGASPAVVLDELTQASMRNFYTPAVGREALEQMEVLALDFWEQMTVVGLRAFDQLLRGDDVSASTLMNE